MNINGFEIPEPERRPLKYGQTYFVPDICWAIENAYVSVMWADCEEDDFALENGVVHLNEEAAQQHAKALLSFTWED